MILLYVAVVWIVFVSILNFLLDLVLDEDKNKGKK